MARGMKLVVMAVLVAVPAMHPAKTLGVIKSAQASWEHLWTIEGMRGA